MTKHNETMLVVFGWGYLLSLIVARINYPAVVWGLVAIQVVLILSSLVNLVRSFDWYQRVRHAIQMWRSATWPCYDEGVVRARIIVFFVTIFKPEVGL